MEHRCVERGYRVKVLFVQYSPENVRLMKCDNCKAVADEYIECEFVIILIDLILHKPKAYRHLLYNVFNQEAMNFQGLLLKSTWMLRSLLLKRYEEEWGFSTSFSLLVWQCQEMFMDGLVGKFLFIFIFLLAMRTLLNTTFEIFSWRDLWLAILVSSSFKIFLVATMLREFPSSVIFIIDLFVLLYNTVALKG